MNQKPPFCPETEWGSAALSLRKPEYSGVLLRREPTPSLRAPIGAFEPALNGLGCAPLFRGRARCNGGAVASPILQAGVSRNAAQEFPRSFAGRECAPLSTAVSPAVTALSVEFVAKPQEARGVQAAIPAALAGAFQDVSGFAGCLVMVSEQEARLVTVITLWVGDDRQKVCRENAR